MKKRRIRTKESTNRSYVKSVFGKLLRIHKLVNIQIKTQSGVNGAELDELCKKIDWSFLSKDSLPSKMKYLAND